MEIEHVGLGMVKETIENARRGSSWAGLDTAMRDGTAKTKGNEWKEKDGHCEVSEEREAPAENEREKGVHSVPIRLFGREKGAK
jgi:hypothetical protein